MKSNYFVIMALIISMGCSKKAELSNSNFISERISKTASFIVNANINNVFPLYGAFEERKWAPGWEPALIYPEKEIIEEGTTFRIELDRHDHGNEAAALWIVSKYEPSNYLIQYLVSTQNRFWKITVENLSIENDTKTKTTVTYTFTGINNIGNSLNKKSIEKMYKNDLQDWASLINGYLEGK